ncbi:hypothetical protein ACQJ9V_06790, partial [Helicobacter pylori]
NEQEVTNILNANTENIKNEIKKLENQIIETATRLLTSYQIFLNNAKESANTEINTNKTESLEAIEQAKESANTEINTNKTESLEAIEQAKESANTEINTNKTESLEAIEQAKESANTEINTNKTESLEAIEQAKESANTEINTNKTQATTEITEAKKTAFNELLETLKPKFSGLFVGVYYVRNVIYVNGGWEQKIKDLSDYTLDKNKKYEIEVFFSFVSAKILEANAVFGLKVQEGFLKESIQKIRHKYVSQIYYAKLLVENASGVLGLYHGYFYGNINYFNEAVVTSIREIPNDTIISKVSNGSNFSTTSSFTQNLNDTNKTTIRSN